MSTPEEISWVDIRAALRRNQAVIMDPTTTERVLHMFKHAYRGEAAVCMDLFSGLELPVLEQIQAAASSLGEMAGYFKQEVMMSSSEDEKWAVITEPPDEETSDLEPPYDHC